MIIKLQYNNTSQYEYNHSVGATLKKDKKQNMI